MKQGQSFWASLVEAGANTLSGYLISIWLMVFLVARYHMQASTGTSVKVVGWFTVVSILRSFLWRRLFNWITVKWAQWRCQHSDGFITKTIEWDGTWHGQCAHCGKQLTQGLG